MNEEGSLRGSHSVVAWRIEPMKRRHLRAVLDIERDAFPIPWSREAFIQEMEGNPVARAFVAVPPAAAAGREATAGGTPSAPRVSGYICFWIVCEELRINNLAVAPTARRRGAGERLLRFALDSGVEAGCEEALLEVRPSNAAALALYERAGFESIGRRPRYYSDSGEDALVLRRRLSRSAG